MIRRAVRDDIAAIVALLGRHHAERGQVELPFAFDPVVASIDAAEIIARPDWLCLVGDDAGAVCGLFAATASRPLFAPVPVAIEIMLRCERPGLRAKFVAEFETWARGQGCGGATLASTHSFKPIGRLYARDGYLPAEMSFVKRLAPAPFVSS